MSQEKSIWILVDYSNLHRLDSQRGIAYLAAFFLERLGKNRLSAISRARIRLYGGWYERDKLTRLAQDIVADIAKAFPTVIQVAEVKIRVTVEIARSLVISPDHDFLHTYRPRPFPGNIKCADPPFVGCVDNENCPIVSVGTFVNMRECERDECGVRPKHVFSKPEQKLVDSMIVADVISLASRGEDCAIISSDDDIWPGIRTAVEYGNSVYHLHSKPGQMTPSNYVDGIGSNYTQLSYPT